MDEILDLYVSESNGYFISYDLKNALNITNNFIYNKFKLKQIVSNKRIGFRVKSFLPANILIFAKFLEKNLKIIIFNKKN